jgi:hypothetical protein
MHYKRKKTIKLCLYFCDSLGRSNVPIMAEFLCSWCFIDANKCLNVRSSCLSRHFMYSLFLHFDSGSTDMHLFRKTRLNMDRRKNISLFEDSHRNCTLPDYDKYAHYNDAFRSILQNKADCKCKLAVDLYRRKYKFRCYSK